MWQFQLYHPLLPLHIQWSYHTNLLIFFLNAKWHFTTLNLNTCYSICLGTLFFHILIWIPLITFWMQLWYQLFQEVLCNPFPDHSKGYSLTPMPHKWFHLYTIFLDWEDGKGSVYTFIIFSSPAPNKVIENWWVLIKRFTQDQNRAGETWCLFACLLVLCGGRGNGNIKNVDFAIPRLSK